MSETLGVPVRIATSTTFTLPAADGFPIAVTTYAPAQRVRGVVVINAATVRLTGRKDVLNEVKKREGSMVELTGLVRKNAVSPPQGVSVGGVRIGIGAPQQPISDPARTPDMYQPVFDVEAYQLLPEPCSTK